MSDPADLEGRCGTCARFVRVVEVTEPSGHTKRRGECLLGVWQAPIWETSTCSQYVKRGTFTGKPVSRVRRTEGRPRAAHGESRSFATGGNAAGTRLEVDLPEELLEMNADEFREVLRAVLRDELGLGEANLGGRWQGGEVILKPGKEGTQERRIPLESLFNKVVLVRDKLRVLEQKINAHAKLTPEEKVQMQQYITGCYGSLTTFNVLFADKADMFVGQKGED